MIIQKEKPRYRLFWILYQGIFVYAIFLFSLFSYIKLDFDSKSTYIGSLVLAQLLFNGFICILTIPDTIYILFHINTPFLDIKLFPWHKYCPCLCDIVGVIYLQSIILDCTSFSIVSYDRCSIIVNDINSCNLLNFIGQKIFCYGLLIILSIFLVLIGKYLYNNSDYGFKYISKLRKLIGIEYETIPDIKQNKITQTDDHSLIV
jgi:hypothetical protein